MSRATWSEHFRSQWSNYLITLLALVVVLSGLRYLQNEIRHELIERRPASDWVVYHDVRFVGVDEAARGGLGALDMESEVTSFLPRGDTRYRDVLRCERQGQRAEDRLEYVSVMETSAGPTEPHEREVFPWHYAADFPRGAACRVRSTISFEVDGVTKTIVHETQRFSIPAEATG